MLEQGFTLVELLIVIIILGILAGIVVFAVGNLTQNSSKSACATEAQTFVTAYNAYAAANNGTKPGVAANKAAHGGTLTLPILASEVMTDLSTPGTNQYLTKTPATLTGTPKGFWDSADSTTAGAVQNTVNATSNSNGSPAWAFDPASGNIVQSSGSVGTPLATNPCS